ncbi:MAG: GNAT family N-acetyltransferase [Parabacteroides sp.]|nr:GNAT family N-acetyltransferase [Parabacteroides sp.]
MYSIKEATTDDCLIIQKIASQTWAATYSSILSKEQLDYMYDMMYSTVSLKRQMEVLKHKFFIIYSNGIPSGYLSIEKKADNRFNFQKIYSLPSIHGKGIGRFIIEQGIEYLRKNYIPPFVIELYVNRYNPAVNFYKHMGLSIIDTRDHDIGNGFFMNDYIMEMEVK